jgi:hypothetical protein
MNRRRFRTPMVGDLAQAAPKVSSWPEDAPPDIASMPPPAGLTQIEWTTYAVEAVLEKRPFRFSDEPVEDARETELDELR